jgi:hypothetical protein
MEKPNPAKANLPCFIGVHNNMKITEIGYWKVVTKQADGSKHLHMLYLVGRHSLPKVIADMKGAKLVSAELAASADAPLDMEHARGYQHGLSHKFTTETQRAVNLRQMKAAMEDQTTAQAVLCYWRGYEKAMQEQEALCR